MSTYIQSDLYRQYTYRVTYRVTCTDSILVYQYIDKNALIDKGVDKEWVDYYLWSLLHMYMYMYSCVITLQYIHVHVHVLHMYTCICIQLYNVVSTYIYYMYLYMMLIKEWVGEYIYSTWTCTCIYM